MREEGPRPEREPRWHASLAALAAVALYILLPQRLTIGPAWIAPAVVLGVLIPLSILVPHRHAETQRSRFWSIFLIATVTFFNFASVTLLVAGFTHPEKASLHTAASLLRYGAQIWITNILVFALWFWEIDGNGPEARARPGTALEFKHADFLFPQMQMSVVGTQGSRYVEPEWRPLFVDYLYLAFTNATAFSPADVLPISRWAKVLMALEALISLVTVAVVLARSINLMQ
jgi:hypothetical protein